MAGAFAFEREDARWQGFRPFARWPKIEAVAGHTYWIDLNGDGRADAVVARGDALVWFPSSTAPLDERDGEFDDAITVPLPTGSDRAPGGVPDPSLGLTFADLDGDGLPDLVRVQRGGVEYWPSLGNGRFGERMIMSGAAELGQLADFDHRRVRWVDLDGSGTADLVYLRHGEVWLWPNLGGRRFGPLQRLRRQGGIVEAEGQIDWANVMLMCNKCITPVRIKFQHLEGGKKVRVCRKCNELIDA